MKCFLYLKCLGKCCLLPFSYWHFSKWQYTRYFSHYVYRRGINIYNVVMIANSAVSALFSIKCYISLCFYLPKTQTSLVSIFNLPQFFFWTNKDNWTNSLIAMQVLFVRHIILEADSRLVKLVVITDVFFNKQQQKIEI